MKIPKDLEKEIIDGMLPLLKKVVEEKEHIKKVEGRALIYEGITKDKDGKQIRPGTLYVISEIRTMPVNHGRRLREIIEKSKNMADLNEDLARYLVKFGISKQAITDSIPNSMRPLDN
jgi:hypothetical protein